MCECAKQMDEHLEPYNAALVTTMFGPPQAVIETYKLRTIRSNKKPPKVLATYCPFCGVKYPK